MARWGPKYSALVLGAGEEILVGNEGSAFIFPPPFLLTPSPVQEHFQMQRTARQVAWGFKIHRGSYSTGSGLLAP